MPIDHPVPNEFLLNVGKLISQIPGSDDRFPAAELAEHWRLRGCGIACVRMVFDAFDLDPAPYWSLVSEGLERGAYCDRGWIHQGLVDMLDRRGAMGRAVRDATVGAIAAELAAGNLVIASVTVCFRGGQSRVSESGTVSEGRYTPGGHLVLVTGMRGPIARPTGFRVHHPSASEANNLADHWVDVEPMAVSFSGN